MVLCISENVEMNEFRYNFLKEAYKIKVIVHNGVQAHFICETINDQKKQTYKSQRELCIVGGNNSSFTSPSIRLICPSSFSFVCV